MKKVKNRTGGHLLTIGDLCFGNQTMVTNRAHLEEIDKVIGIDLHLPERTSQTQ